MRYLTLLYGREEDNPEPGTPEFDADMAGYMRFDEVAGTAIVSGEPLQGTTTVVTVRPGDGAPLVTAGPFAEGAEAIGGFYVLETGTLDDAIELVQQIPAVHNGTIELRPLVEWFARDDVSSAGNGGALRFLALIQDLPGASDVPGTAEWDAGAAAHGRFGEAAGDAVLAGGALHPADTATTVRVRDGEAILSDGPFAETAEVVGGVYLLAAPTVEAAAELAARIPVGAKGAIELIPIMELGD